MTQARQAAAFSARNSRRVVVAQMTLSVALLFSGVATADNCKAIAGTVSALDPIRCTGFVGACYQGTFSGDLSGTFKSALTGVTVVDSIKRILSFTARTTIETQTPNGVVYTSDAGTGTGCELVDGQFVCPYATEVLTITSGDRAYKQVYGSITLSGLYMAGQPGVYQGQICHGKGGKG